MRHDFSMLQTAAGMRARGATWVKIAEALGRDERTCRRWQDLPEFKAEVERARSDLAPTPRGVFVHALMARKDDGVDWQARLRAAERLINLDAIPAPADADAAAMAAWEGWDDDA